MENIKLRTLAQRHEINWQVLAASVPLGVAVMAFLWINEFPDARADASAGKRTLVVRLGRPAAALLYPALIVVGFGTLVLLPLAGLPAAVWLGVIGLPHGVAAALRLYRNPEQLAKIVPAQAWAPLSFVLMALGASVGIIL